MTKGVKFFIYFLGLFFAVLPVVFAQDVFYSKDSLITEEVDTIFKIVEHNDKMMTLSSESIYNSDTYTYTRYLYLLVFSKDTNELENKILIYQGSSSIYKEDIDFKKINNNEAFITYGHEVVKINLDDYSIVSKKDDINAYRIKRINDNFLLYYYSSLYIVDENLNVLYSSDKYAVEDVEVVGSNVYVLVKTNSVDEDSVYHYQYTIYTLDDKLQFLSEKNYRYEDDTKSIQWAFGSIGELVKNEEDYYYVSHMITKFNSNGIMEEISGSVYPQENGTDYSMIQKYGSYFILGGYKIENGVTNAFVEVRDGDFNLLQEIDVNELCGKNIEDGLSVVKTITLTDKGFYANGIFRDASIGLEQGFSVEFLLYYGIESKTDGNGSIEVVSTSKADESIKFKVIPNEGYVLNSVKVTDKEGNVVEFKDNVFTMPSADVIIEATFIQNEDNPNTATMPTIIAFIFLISVVGIVLFSRRKIMFE